MADHRPDLIHVREYPASAERSDSQHRRNFFIEFTPTGQTGETGRAGNGRQGEGAIEVLA